MATQEEADRALNVFGNQLFSKNPNLVKISVVPEVDSEGKSTGGFILEAGVLSMAVQNNAAALGAQLSTEFVPLELPVPDAMSNATGGRVRVNVVQVGEIRALSCSLQIAPQPISILAFTNRIRPVNGGNSVGNARYNNAGTFGSVVRLKNDTTNRYFLSNWHVLVGGSGQTGDQLIQPRALMVALRLTTRSGLFTGSSLIPSSMRLLESPHSRGKTSWHTDFVVTAATIRFPLTQP